MADATETVGTEGTTNQHVAKRVIGQTTRRRSSTRPSTLVAGRPAVIPGGRAVVGALLVVLAALLTFVAYTRANRRPS